MKFSSDFSQNINEFKNALHTDRCFDVVYRTTEIGGKKCCLFFVDGMTKDEVLLRMLQIFQAVKPEDMPADAHGFSKKTDTLRRDRPGSANSLRLSPSFCPASPAFLLRDMDTCLTIDCRTYPARSVSEPEKDKVMRGSRDGFVETLIFNTALIRRRIRDPKLIMEIMNAGESSHTEYRNLLHEGPGR